MRVVTAGCQRCDFTCIIFEGSLSDALKKRDAHATLLRSVAKNLHKIWIEQCKSARGIEDQFGTVDAMKYLVGEKFFNYLDAAERDAEFRAEIPAFIAEIKTIFEQWQLAEYLEKAGWAEPINPSIDEEEDDNPEFIEMERKDNICVSPKKCC